RSGRLRRVDRHVELRALDRATVVPLQRRAGRAGGRSRGRTRRRTGTGCGFVVVAAAAIREQQSARQRRRAQASDRHHVGGQRRRRTAPRLVRGSHDPPARCCDEPSATIGAVDQQFEAPHPNGAVTINERSKRSRTRRNILVGVLLVVAGLWGYAIWYSVARPSPESLDGDAKTAVTNACTDARTQLRALPPLA